MTKKGGIAILLILAGVAAAGYFIWVDYHYTRVYGYTEDGEYAKALENMANVPDFYRDIKQIRDFDNAGLAMTAGNWDQAKQAFGALGTYMNADKMIIETDYARAKKDLDAGKLDQAKQELQALGDYRDAKKLAARIDYLKAKNLIDKKDYENGFKLLKTMPDDTEAADLLNRTQESIYTQSVQDYVSGYPDKTKFSLIPGYKDTDKYTTLIQSLTPGKVPYEKMVELSGFANTYTIIMSEYILDYLNGQWLDYNKNVSFTMRQTAANWEHWKVSCSLMPGTDPRAYIMGRVLLVGDNKSWKYVYEFTYLSMNEMTMKDIQTGKDYYMVRVSAAQGK